MFILLYLLCGTLAGFFAGLLGIGGGLVVVPILSLIFTMQGNFSQSVIMHMTLACSLSSILFTSISSSFFHSRHNNVRWDFFRKMFIPILIGTTAGAFLAAYLSTDGLYLFFTVFLFLIATQILFDYYPKSEFISPRRKDTMLRVAGLGIGGMSSLVGLGGGSLSVPFMRYCGVDMHKAVGTSCALSWPIAIAGTASFIFTGWGSPYLPEYSLGYVYIPATLAISVTSVLFAPLGAKLSFRLPVNTLRKTFAIFLYIIAFRMVFSIT